MMAFLALLTPFARLPRNLTKANNEPYFRQKNQCAIFLFSHFFRMIYYAVKIKP